MSINCDEIFIMCMMTLHILSEMSFNVCYYWESLEKIIEDFVNMDKVGVVISIMTAVNTLAAIKCATGIKQHDYKMISQFCTLATIFIPMKLFMLGFCKIKSMRQIGFENLNNMDAYLLSSNFVILTIQAGVIYYVFDLKWKMEEETRCARASPNVFQDSLTKHLVRAEINEIVDVVNAEIIAIVTLLLYGFSVPLFFTCYYWTPVKEMIQHLTKIDGVGPPIAFMTVICTVEAIKCASGIIKRDFKMMSKFCVLGKMFWCMSMYMIIFCKLRLLIQSGPNRLKDEDGFSMAGSLIILFAQMVCLYPVICIKCKLENESRDTNTLRRDDIIVREEPPSYESFYGDKSISNFTLPPAYIESLETNDTTASPQH